MGAGFRGGGGAAVIASGDWVSVLGEEGVPEAEVMPGKVVQATGLHTEAGCTMAKPTHT